MDNLPAGGSVQPGGEGEGPVAGGAAAAGVVFGRVVGELAVAGQAAGEGLAQIGPVFLQRGAGPGGRLFDALAQAEAKLGALIEVGGDFQFDDFQRGFAQAQAAGGCRGRRWLAGRGRGGRCRLRPARRWAGR